MRQNSIYYIFAMDPITGGDFVALDHITALDAMGFDVKAFFLRVSDTTIKLGVPLAAAGTQIQPGDIVVIGEGEKKVLNPLYDVDCIKILNNQNPYLTYLGFGTVAKLNAFHFRRVLVPSDFCAARLGNIGVTAPMSRVRPALPDYFKPGAKRLQIAFSPIKRRHEPAFLIQYFRAEAPEFADVPWLALENLPRREAAAIMAQSAVYAAFPKLESLGLMSLEAMASGCHVVGYTGLGGTEYATPENGDWIDEGDHRGFVDKLRAALQLHASGTADPKVEAGYRTAEMFARANFESELEAAWLSIMGDDVPRYRKPAFSGDAFGGVGRLG